MSPRGRFLPVPTRPAPSDSPLSQQPSSASPVSPSSLSLDTEGISGFLALSTKQRVSRPFPPPPPPRVPVPASHLLSSKPPGQGDSFLIHGCELEIHPDRQPAVVFPMAAAPASKHRCTRFGPGSLPLRRRPGYPGNRLLLPHSPLLRSSLGFRGGG